MSDNIPKPRRNRFRRRPKSATFAELKQREPAEGYFKKNQSPDDDEMRPGDFEKMMMFEKEIVNATDKSAARRAKEEKEARRQLVKGANLLPETTLKRLFTEVQPDLTRSQDFKDVTHAYCSHLFDMLLNSSKKAQLDVAGIAKAAEKQLGKSKVLLKEFKVAAETAVAREIDVKATNLSIKKIVKVYQKTLTAEAVVYLLSGISQLFSVFAYNSGKAAVRLGKKRVTADHVREAYGSSKDPVVKKFTSS